MLNKLKSFFSSTLNVLLALLAIAGVVIYYLSGKNDYLKALLNISETKSKDEELKKEQDKVKSDIVKETKKEEQLLKDQDTAKKEADKSNPEDFWKKH